uniref:Uncharacterized protein n=1 Tax=viral metagenome TaxID=1070528 RepID=A0A6C0KHU2_9ZZZZ
MHHHENDRESLKRLFTQAFHEKEAIEQAKPRKATFIPRSVMMKQKKEKRENNEQINELTSNLNFNLNLSNNLNNNINIEDEKEFPTLGKSSNSSEQPKAQWPLLERQYAVVHPPQHAYYLSDCPIRQETPIQEEGDGNGDEESWEKSIQSQSEKFSTMKWSDIMD